MCNWIVLLSQSFSLVWFLLFICTHCYAQNQIVAACTRVQMIKDRLEAEGIATKWLTGSAPILRTLAFRELVGAGPTDRVAGLLMVGGGAAEWSSSSRRRCKDPNKNRQVLVEDL
mmetsp:Transcript_33062/g.76171  ORF Transcript_33062/g.76171 Transcript_33062/m.76171 type:complete len:115 (-) Transcript_33062:222-566(-)